MSLQHSFEKQDRASMIRSSHENKNNCRRARFSACALAFGFGAVTQAEAQVIEIGRDGTMVVYDRPAVITPESTIPIAATTPSPTQRVPAHIARSLAQAGSDAALSPQLLEAVAWAESRFNAHAVSPRGAVGVMQLMPGTAADLGVDPADPDANVRGGARYLRRMLEIFDGDIELALAAYNAGPSRANTWRTWGPFREPAEFIETVPFHQTRGYIQIVLRNADVYRRLYASATPDVPTYHSKPAPPKRRHTRRK